MSGTLDLPNSGLVSSGTLGVGTWVVGPNSTLTISGVSSISTLSANVTLQGSGATFTGISSLSLITAAGELNSRTVRSPPPAISTMREPSTWRPAR